MAVPLSSVSPEIGPSTKPFDGLRAVSMVERLGPP